MKVSQKCGFHGVPTDSVSGFQLYRDLLGSQYIWIEATRIEQEVMKASQTGVPFWGCNYTAGFGFAWGPRMLMLVMMGK